MDKKNNWLIIALAVTLLILTVVFLFLKFGWSAKIPKNILPKKENTAETAVTPDAAQEIKTISGKTINGQSVPVSTPAPRQIGKDDLMRIAASFTERFGSYSNQSNFNNITDLKIFMTSNMAVWADKYLAEQRAKNTDNAVYYGITTKSVSQEVKNYDDTAGQASILVKTRRREAIGSTGNTTKVFDQEIMVNFSKENGTWKVDSANWQNK